MFALIQERMASLISLVQQSKGSKVEPLLWALFVLPFGSWLVWINFAYRNSNLEVKVIPYKKIECH